MIMRFVLSIIVVLSATIALGAGRYYQNYCPTCPAGATQSSCPTCPNYVPPAPSYQTYAAPAIAAPAACTPAQSMPAQLGACDAVGKMAPGVSAGYSPTAPGACQPIAGMASDYIYPPGWVMPDRVPRDNPASPTIIIKSAGSCPPPTTGTFAIPPLPRGNYESVVVGEAEEASMPGEIRKGFAEWRANWLKRRAEGIEKRNGIK